MSVGTRLHFDPTDANSIAASHNVGAFVRSKAGTLIDAQSIDSMDWLNVASALFDGSGNAISSTTGALDVNIASGTLDVDDSLANTALANTATPVSTTAVVVVSSALTDRKWLYLANEGNKKLYFGMSTGLTTANGFPLHPGERAELRIGATPVVKAIGGTGASNEDLRVLELS